MSEDHGSIVCALRRCGWSADLARLAEEMGLDSPSEIENFPDCVEVVNGVAWLEECPSPCSGCGEEDD